MSEIIMTSAQKRQDAQRKAAAIGIDEAYIATLVETFYGHIQQHEILGPIFAEKIVDWAPHLATMKDFWASVALSAGTYHGRPMQKHLALKTVNAQHFEIWLNLFEETLAQTAPNPDVVDYFMVRARNIAKSLQLGMFGTPGLPKRDFHHD